MTAFDTNVLIYSCDKADRERQHQALELVSSIRDGVLLWQVACEFVAAARKLSAQGFTTAQTWILHLKEQWSFWDAMIVAACLTSGVRRLYSEDISGREVPGLEIVNPFSGR